MQIKEIHKNNFRIIKELNLKVNTELKHKVVPGCIIKIIAIHSLYGWVLTEYLNYSRGCKLNQDLSNINEWEVL